MTMAVYQFFGKNKSYWNYIFADIVLTCIPVVIVYMIGQKYIVGGMTSGAVKEEKLIAKNRVVAYNMFNKGAGR